MIPEKMFCAECQRLGLKSVVVVPSGGFRTAMLPSPAYYDEDGNYHPSEDPNKTTLEWECSQGHRWKTVE